MKHKVPLTRTPKENYIKYYTFAALIIVVDMLVYYLYTGLLHTTPTPGDSWDYHIPISHMILSGSFLHPTHVKLPQWYYPGSSEAINALLLLLHIPLTISNLFAIVMLGFTCFLLGKKFRLGYYTSILFALTIISLTAVIRWANAVSIDVWVAVFFLWGILFLESIQPKIKQFILLGVALGMLIGSKYTAGLFVAELLIFYGKEIKRTISFTRFLYFLIPFSLLGLFWYTRNYFVIGNPFYPLTILGFKGVPLFTDTVWHETVNHPMQMINAFFSEYKFWMVAPIALVVQAIKEKLALLKTPIGKLTLIGLINLFFYGFFPTSSQPWIMVSSLRYSYPAFIPLILAVFLVAEKYKKLEMLSLFCLINMQFVLSMSYYPKLLFLSLPISAGLILFIQKYEIHQSVK